MTERRERERERMYFERSDSQSQNTHCLLSVPEALHVSNLCSQDVRDIRVTCVNRKGVHTKVDSRNRAHQNEPVDICGTSCSGMLPPFLWCCICSPQGSIQKHSSFAQ